MTNEKTKKAFLTFALISYVSLIWYVSSLPIPTKKELPPFTDKIAHIILYAGLAGIISELSFSYYPKENKYRVFLFAVVCGTIYGALDELHQRYVPGRTSSIFDLTADIVGSFIGAYIITRKNRQK